MASIAVLPAPITAMRRPRFNGVSNLGNLPACIRLQRVNNSLAESTPLRNSPGIFINRGVPAPVPINTESKPISSIICSMVNKRPTSVLHSISTPSFAKASISALITVSGKRNSGIPYLSTPPGLWKASYTVTSQPALAMSAAQAIPAGPDPTMPILKPLGSM